MKIGDRVRFTDGTRRGTIMSINRSRRTARVHWPAASGKLGKQLAAECPHLRVIAVHKLSRLVKAR